MAIPRDDHRRRPSARAPLAAVLTAAAALLARDAAAASGPATSARPNIVFILTDDLDVQHPTGGWIDRLPRLKKLFVDEGTRFANHFVATSLCCPSRATILRGQYAHNTGVVGNGPPYGGFEKFHDAGLEASTVAVWLQHAGYRTAYVGKYLNGYGGQLAEDEADKADAVTPRGPAPSPTTEPGASSGYVPPGWDDWYAAFGPTLYYQYGYSTNENGRIVAHGTEPADYLEDVITTKALEFLKRQAADAGHRPFLLWFATVSPHGPAAVAPRHLDALPDLRPVRGPSYDQADMSGYPSWLVDRPRIGPERDRRNAELQLRRVRSMLAVEDSVVAIVDALRAANALDRTVLIFTSDNGLHIGQHRLEPGKLTGFEEDVHVPLLVRGPDVPAGRTVDHLTVNTDFAPTFAELAGATAPDFVDGRSLVPLLHASPPPADRWRKGLLIENGPVGPARTYQGVHTKRWAYIEYPVLNERELYDLEHDPYELHNVARTAPGDLVERLSRWTQTLARCRGAACRQAEDAGADVP